MKKFLALSLALLVALCSTVFADETRYRIPLGDSPQLGPENAPVTIIEFIDFQ